MLYRARITNTDSFQAWETRQGREENSSFLARKVANLHLEFSDGHWSHFLDFLALSLHVHEDEHIAP